MSGLEAIGGIAGKAAAGKAAAALVDRALELLGSEEMDRLFADVADRLNAGVGPAGLQPAREDPEVIRLVAAFLDDATKWDEDALVDAIEPYVGDVDEETPASDFARQIAGAIRTGAWRAKETDREALAHRIDRLESERALWARPRYLSPEWIPRQAHAHVVALSETNGDEAAQLEDALRDADRRRETIGALIRQPPRWVREGSGGLWTALGHLALAYGQLPEAEQALVAAAERAGVDRVHLLASASQVAHIGGHDTRAGELLDFARDADPTHPTVALTDARLLDDPRAQVERLDGVAGQTPGQEAAIEATRALAFLALRDVDSAAECRDRALAANPDAPQIRELVPIIVLIENALRTDEAVDWVALVEAARAFLDLREELLPLGRAAEAARMAARASEAYRLAGDGARAANVLEELTEAERAVDDLDARVHIASAAVETGAATFALAILGDAATNEARIIRAHARMAIGPADAVSEAAVDLEALLDSAEPIVRGQAATIRLSAALHYAHVEWSERAVDVLRDVDAVLAAIYSAQREAQSQRFAGAEALLVPHQRDSRALTAMIEIAAERGDFTRAVALQRSLLTRGATPARRLRLAELLEAADDEHEAGEILAGVRADVSAPRDVRATAYGISAQRAWNTQRVADLDAVTAEWLDFAPSSPAAAWARVYALNRTGDYPSALALIDEHELVPRNVGDARFAAQTFFRALEAPEAVRRIAELSDRFGRSDEWLEFMVIVSGIGVPDTLPAESRDRHARAMAEFLTRFPESKMLQAVEFPTRQ